MIKKTTIFKKNIVLGVGGGIAAYKSVSLLRQLVKLGANVQVVMSENATKFVGSMTFEALSSKPVLISLFKPSKNEIIPHIKLIELADVIILAPATANIIAKIGNGIADDALSTIMLAATCPVIVCPSMNSNMYEHPATQKNLNRIKQYGHFVLSANEGELACGIKGIGRLPEADEIIDRLISYMTKNDMISKRVLVTAGPTIEVIDPSRFISNPSSGKMGYSIARAAENRGAKVTLISGTVSIKPPVNINLINIRSATEMADEVLKNLNNYDIIIKVAAVSDYRPKNILPYKLKKTKANLSLKLERNIDILKQIGKIVRRDQVVVGFAAETCDITKNAKEKMKNKNLDMIVANLIGGSDSGFSSENNEVKVFFRDGRSEDIDTMSKESLAHVLLDRIIAISDIKQR